MSTDKEYCSKFINFLLENNKIEDNRMDKADARKIYMEVFKLNNKRSNFPFSSLYKTLVTLNFVKHNKHYLVFIPSVLKHFITDQTSKQKADVDSNITHAIQYQTTKPPTDKTSSHAFRCNICQVKFADQASLNEHLANDYHLLLSRYVNNKNSLINSIAGLTIEVGDNHGNTEETFLLQPNVSREILLKIENYSGGDFVLTRIIILTPTTDVNLSKLNVLTILNGTRVVFKITVQFENIQYLSYPLIFGFKDVKSGKLTDVLKELTFHVHTNAITTVHAEEPYKKIKTSQVFGTNIGIVRGEHMKRTGSDFVPSIILQQYHISDDLLQIFNNNLNDFDGMNKQQRIMVSEIRTLLYNFKNKHSEKLNEHNYYEMLRLLLFLEEYQMKLDIMKYSCDNILIPAKGCHKNCLELKVPGLSEHRPSLLRGDSVFISDDSNNHIKYEGIVHKVQQDSVILGFSHKFINKVFIKNKSFSTTFGFNRVTIRAEHQAINIVNEHRVITLLCKNNFQTHELKNHQIVWFNKNIANNLEQQQAVRHILSQTSRPMPYLIFGPPGTGKTVTIVEAVLQVWKLLPSKNILVCAPSNNAADEVTKRLVKIVPKRDLIRYIAPSYPFEKVYPEVKPFTNHDNNDYYHPPNKTLQTYRIVVTTLINASRLVNGGTPKGHFEFVFIDEAAQATESETLIPIAGILTSQTTKGAINGQIILAGDPKQLGPIIHSQIATEYGFDISMLERLMKNSSAYEKNKENDQYNKAVLTKLVQSYRSHPMIIKVPNHQFYENELVPAGDKAMTHIAIGWEHLPNPNSPVLFHSVIGKDEREQHSPSFFNVQEIDVVLNYLRLLIGNRLQGMKISEEHIGIITPYRKQVEKLRKVCDMEQYGKQLFIGSVEQFQGQERLIIIVTTVRSRPNFTSYDAKFHLGFLRNPKRFNVAITRAKALLIVIGNPKILLTDPYWHSFIKYCNDNGSVGGTPFSLETDVTDLTSRFEYLEFTEKDSVENNEEDGPNFSRGRI